MKIEELKQLLIEVLDNLEQYDDKDEVKMVSNTYFLGNPNHFLGIAGYNGGYIALDDIEIVESEEE